MHLTRPLVRSLVRPLVQPLAGLHGRRFDVLDLEPDFASSSEYGWLNASGQPAQYLETIPTFTNAGSGADGEQGTANQQPVCLEHDGENYLHCPGTTGNGASVALSGIGTLATWIMEVSIDCREMSDSGSSLLLPNNASIEWVLGSTGYMHFNGGGGGGLFVGGIDPLGENVWRLIGHGDLLEAQRLIEGVWTTIGTNAGVTHTDLPFDGTAYIGVDVPHARWPLRGKIHYAKIWSGDDDSVDPIFHVDFSTFAHGATSGDAATGQTVTILQSGGNAAGIIGHSCFRLDGVDDRFTIPGLSVGGPMTFVAVMELTNKLQQIAWSIGAVDAYAWNIEDDNFPADYAPSGNGSYRKNGAPIVVTGRDDLGEEIRSQRVLLVSSYTFTPVAGDLQFGGISEFGGFQLQGDVEALFVFKRILTPQEIAKLETYLMARHGIS